MRNDKERVVDLLRRCCEQACETERVPTDYSTKLKADSVCGQLVPPAAKTMLVPALLELIHAGEVRLIDVGGTYRTAGTLHVQLVV